MRLNPLKTHIFCTPSIALIEGLNKLLYFIEEQTLAPHSTNPMAVLRRKLIPLQCVCWQRIKRIVVCTNSSSSTFPPVMKASSQKYPTERTVQLRLWTVSCIIRKPPHCSQNVFFKLTSVCSRLFLNIFFSWPLPYGVRYLTNLLGNTIRI